MSGAEAMDAADCRTPVTVVTGFLGSGKTTALNHLLRQPGLEGTVAIINEFGAVGLDHLLIEASEEQLALLDNGCICCTVRGDLIATLRDVEQRAAAGHLPALRRVLIETTGLADPVPILHTLLVEPDVVRRYSIDGVVATVDAVNGAATLDRHPEAIKQVAVADRLLLTKVDLAEAIDLERLQHRLRAINPAARRLTVDNGRVAASDILGPAMPDTGTKSADVLAWFAEAAAAPCHDGHAGKCADAGCNDRGHAGDHRDDHGVQSYSLVIDEPIEWAAFTRWLDYVLALKGQDLLRVKGLIHTREEPDRPLVVHGVQHVFHPPARLRAWPSDDRRTRIIFIVRDIPREAIERTLTRIASIDAGRIERPRR